MNVKKVLCLHAGIVPLWLLPFGIQAVVSLLLLLIISFGLASDRSIQTITLAIQCGTQSIVAFLASLWGGVLFSMITKRKGWPEWVLFLLWLVPAALYCIFMTSGRHLSIDNARYIAFSAPLLTHFYLHVRIMRMLER
ncbi:MAG: hypothetical protein JW913_05555 [Chitinispirillaceae bacterium]|nr:hypothetical protein [Chitinispirillaceae bacterium]